MANEPKQTFLIVTLCVFWYICSSTNNVIGKNKNDEKYYFINKFVRPSIFRKNGFV